MNQQKVTYQPGSRGLQVMLVGLYTPQTNSTGSYISGSYICYTSYIAKLPYKWLNSGLW